MQKCTVGIFLLYYCKRVIYGTYFLLPLVHKQFVRGSFLKQARYQSGKVMVLDQKNVITC